MSKAGGKSIVRVSLNARCSLLLNFSNCDDIIKYNLFISLETKLHLNCSLRIVHAMS